MCSLVLHSQILYHMPPSALCSRLPIPANLKFYSPYIEKKGKNRIYAANSAMAKKPVKYCVIDAFTDSAFKGNPAAVCLLEEDRDDEWLQAVAREFNQPMTCYLAPVSDSAGSGSVVPRFGARYFTTVAEMKVCGHGMLAASHFLFSQGLVKSDAVEFSSPLSGIWTAKRKATTKISSPEPDLDLSESNGGFTFQLDFPAFSLKEITNDDGPLEISSSVSKCLNGAPVIEIYASEALGIIFVLPSGEAVVDVVPNFDEMRRFRGRGITLTGIAPAGSGVDFFSRFFSPKEGIDEDPVCGSAHCALAPYWSKKLGKSDLIAYQASQRGGVLNLHVDEKNGRVLIGGQAITLMEGSILI